MGGATKRKYDEVEPSSGGTTQTPQLSTEYGSVGNAESVKSELAVFDGNSYQVTHIKCQWVALHPQNQYQGVNGCNINFKIPTSAGWYTDLSDSYMVITLGVRNSTGGAVPTAEKVSWENCILTTLFKDVSFSGKAQTKIEGENQNYAYRAYLYNLINAGVSAKKNQMQVLGWERDTPGEYDSFISTLDANSKIKGNEGYYNRQKWATSDGNIQVAGFVHLDTWLQRTYFLDGEEFDLVFKLNDPAFVLHLEAANKNSYKIDVVDCCLYLRQVQMSPSVLIGHARGLQTQNAIYPYIGHKIFTKLIKMGGLTDRAETFFHGVFPKGIILGLVDHEAYCGNYYKNPFNFQHFGLTSIEVLVNGHSIPQPAYKPDYDKGYVAREYLNFYLQLCAAGFIKDDMGISLKDYVGGCALYVFNLSPDLSFGGHAQLQRLTNVTVEMTFKTAITKTLTLVGLALYDTSVEMTSDRRWLLDPSQAAN